MPAAASPVRLFIPGLSSPCCLPFSPFPRHQELPPADPEDLNGDMIFEQDPIQILNAILPLYINGQVLRMLQESVASELGARMAAMQSASDNAEELADKLSIIYNRARQVRPLALPTTVRCRAVPCRPVLGLIG